MIVFGDASRVEDSRAKLARLDHQLRRADGMPPVIGRHGALVTALIEAGELVQGIADAAFEATGRDDASPVTEAAMALATAIARAVRDSWEAGFAGGAVPDEAAIAAVARAGLPESLRTRRAEGFAYYALYPEAYAVAASALPPGPVRVIGIRSIGTTLGAMVAAALDARPPMTVRPVGHPFRRELAVSDAWAGEMLTDRACRFAVVDEGPGLSGSSFGAVADLLDDRGVAPGRVHFFPGHGGAPGPQASASHRALWERTPRHVTSLETLLLGTTRPEHRLESWVAGLVGEAVRPMEDVSGGAWRALRFAREAEWPAIHPHQERRKFLHRTAEGTWLVKFAGLGRHGEEALARAEVLSGAGLTPEVAGLCHGFLVERWVEDAGPVDPTGEPASRANAIGRYIGRRARLLSTAAEDGASAAALWRMARHNATLALGEEVARGIDRWEPDLPELDRRIRRVWTDNRMHAWEWLRRPDGTLLKTDAVDHAAAHDLIGCQDPAWDVVGAEMEWGIAATDGDRLRGAVEQEWGAPLDPALLAFLRPCYLAFQLGRATMAAEASAGWPEEEARGRAAAARYAAHLRGVLTG
ncbi:hypothetical protein [Muricoccus radiodurans]|uniref:hypothetical protein n=1 Tax=Muricoccus radiodurans TaxID=2231721 RepID=UPI003CE7D91C